MLLGLGSDEQLKLQQEYQDYQKKLEQQKAEYRKEHPDEVSNFPSKMYFWKI